MSRSNAVREGCNPGAVSVPGASVLRGEVGVSLPLRVACRGAAASIICEHGKRERGGRKREHHTC